MIEFKSKKPKVSITLDNRVEVTFNTSRAFLTDYDTIGDGEILVSIKDYKLRRSLSQNAYMWVLLGELSSKLGIARNDLYRGYIRDYGRVEYIPLRNEAVSAFIDSWSKNGIGNFAESLRDSKLNGYTTVAVYFGSSSYNSKEMTKLIDPIVNDCKEQGISTMTHDEIMLLHNDNN